MTVDYPNLLKHLVVLNECEESPFSLVSRAGSSYGNDDGFGFVVNVEAWCLDPNVTLE